MTAARIVGDSRFRKNVEFSDLEIRTQLRLPSIECRARKSRLHYFSRFMTDGPKAPGAILSAVHDKVRSKSSPWIYQIRSDLVVSYNLQAPTLMFGLNSFESRRHSLELM